MHQQRPCLYRHWLQGGGAAAGAVLLLLRWRRRELRSNRSLCWRQLGRYWLLPAITARGSGCATQQAATEQSSPNRSQAGSGSLKRGGPASGRHRAALRWYHAQPAPFSLPGRAAPSPSCNYGAAASSRQAQTLARTTAGLSLQEGSPRQSAQGCTAPHQAAQRATGQRNAHRPRASKRGSGDAERSPPAGVWCGVFPEGWCLITPVVLCGFRVWGA